MQAPDVFDHCLKRWFFIYTHELTKKDLVGVTFTPPFSTPMSVKFRSVTKMMEKDFRTKLVVSALIVRPPVLGALDGHSLSRANFCESLGVWAR